MSDVIDAVRAKYPQYKDVPDGELTLAIGAKFPEYLDRSDAFHDEFKVARLRSAATAPDAPQPLSSGELNKIQRTPYENFVMESAKLGARDPQEIGNADFLTAVGRDPFGFLKSLPGSAASLMAAPGSLAYYKSADAVSTLFNDPRYGGNIAAMEHGADQLPADAFVNAAARTNPKLAVTAKLAQSATELAPTLALAAAPAAVNRLLAAGFSASMIAHAPKLFEDYANEINKPAEQQDPGKLADLKSQMIQTFLFAPLAGAGAVSKGPKGEGTGAKIEEGRLKVAGQPADEGAVIPEDANVQLPGRSLQTATVADAAKESETPAAAGAAVGDQGEEAIQQPAETTQALPEQPAESAGGAAEPAATAPEEQTTVESPDSNGATVEEPAAVSTVEAAPASSASGFNPPEMPAKFESLQDVLDYREKYKAAEINFYKSLGLNDAEALKFFRAGDNRSNLDVSKLEEKMTPENRARLDEFSTGEGTQMYQWDRQYDPSELSHETDKAELARHLVQNVSRESLPNEFGDKLLHAAVALRKLKEAGGSWSDIAKELDKTTTRAASSQGDKAEVFKIWGDKLKQFAARQGIELPAGDLAATKLPPSEPPVSTAAPQLESRTEIRATEQAQEPGLAEAAKTLEEAGREPRFEGMGSTPKGKTSNSQQPTSNNQASGGGGAIGGLSRAGKLLSSPSPLEAGRGMQLIVRAYLGKEYGQMRQLDRAFLKFKRYFDRSPKPRNYVYQAGDELAGKMPKGWQVQWAIDSGNLKSLTPAEQSFAKAYRAAMDWAIGVVQEVSPESLRDLYQNYFGRIWKDPEKNANTIRSWINSRPLEGNKSFLKERVLKDWMDGIKMGLEPLSDNPVDMMLYKVGEMVQFAGARMMKQEAKVLGLRKFFYLGEKMPEGWRVDPDPRGEVFAPPVVTIQEAYDAQVRAKTLEMFQKLGIPQQRLVKLGGQRWGDAREGSLRTATGGNSGPGERVRTKFGGPDFVFWHEFGHIMDFRYPDLRTMLGLTKSLRTVTDKELRDLADLRGARQQYARKAEEKMANVFDAYIRAPELFQKTAPTVWRNLQDWLNLHPEVKGPLNEIRPSLKLGADTAQLKLAGPVLLGHWGMPEQAARVMDNFQSRSLLANRKAVAGLRAVNGLLTSARLFGFFHGGMVTNDSFYGGLSLILNDALKGRFSPSEAAKNLLMVPRAFRLGGAIKAGIEGAPYRRGTLFTSEVNAANKELGKLALEANLRSHIGTYDMTMGRRWQRAFDELRTSPSTGAAWETFWRSPFAAMALTMKPVMDSLVPRMKYGMSGLQTMRVLQDLPPVRELAADELFERGVKPADKAAHRAQIQMDLQQRQALRDQLAKSADSVEDRIGQVTYDNLFLNKTLKDASTLALTAFGWHLTKYRGVLGGGLDWARAAAAVARGQKPEITYRMTYLPAMVLGHAIIGGVLQYALTGKPPQSARDYLFPESGLVDAYGKPIRLAIADYVKDIAGDINALRFHGVRGEVDRQVARLAPAWNMAAEMYRNKDFWGNQIFSQQMPQEPEMEHLLKNLGEGVKYLAGSSAPFTLRTGGKLQEAGANPVLSYAAPFVGVVPAPQEATMTPSQALADEVMASRAMVGGRTPEQATKAQAIGQIVRDVRLGKIDNLGDFKTRERAAGVTTKAQETAIQQRVMWTPYQRSVWLMPLDDAMRVWDLANDQERLQLVKFRPGSEDGLAAKVFKAAQSGRLDAETSKRYVSLLLPYWQKAVLAEAKTRQSAVK